MAEPRFWQSAAHPAGLALTPLSWLYGGLERLNRALTQPQHPGKPVICIGNLTAGGGGKTPTVRLVAGWLREAGFAPAVLSRGYGGREKGPLKVDPAMHDAAAVGDEPLMLAAELPVYVCADRRKSLRLAVRDGHDALVKDDGFQNPSMAHHFNLIVVDGATGLGTGRLLPAGPMRQKLAVALPKLDALLVIGAPAHASLAPLIDAVSAAGKPVFSGALHAEATGSGPVHAYCGIAKPEKFRASLEGQGFAVDRLTAFADHHMFSEAEADALLASELPLITTEKDMARLTRAPDGSARAALAARSQVLPVKLAVDDADRLKAALLAALADGQANRTYKSY